jgi:uncharacterized protein YbjT (DUF2867 family)
VYSNKRKIMSSLAVTGASGQLGRLAVQELLARGVPAPDIVAVVRTEARAADLAGRGVQVRVADYSRPKTLVAALAGVSRLLLISSSAAGERLAHHANVIEAAQTAGTRRPSLRPRRTRPLRRRPERSIANADLQTDSQDLAQLLGRPATPLAEVIRAAR